jgi:hypothetical protein
MYYASISQEGLKETTETVNGVPDQIRIKLPWNTSRISPLHDPAPEVRFRAGSKDISLFLRRRKIMVTEGSWFDFWQMQEMFYLLRKQIG